MLQYNLKLEDKLKIRQEDEFAHCKEVAIVTSGYIPDSRVAYGIFLPQTPKETWHAGWRGNGDPAFVHFWVETDEGIIDNAAAQFGEPNTLIVSKNDSRYVRVGYYDIEKGVPVPEVESPKIKWETLTGPGGTVVIEWQEWFENRT